MLPQTPQSPQNASNSQNKCNSPIPCHYGNLTSSQSGHPSAVGTPEYQFTQVAISDDSYPSNSQSDSQFGHWTDSQSGYNFVGFQDSDYRYSQSQRVQTISKGSCFSPVFPKSEYRQNCDLSFCSQIHPPTFSWAQYPPNAFESVPQYSGIYINEIVADDQELSPHTDLFAKQTELKESDRIDIIQLFISKSDIFEVSSKSLFMAVRLFDRILSVCDIKKDQLLLYGISCFSLAAKFNNSFYPQHSSYAKELDNKFTDDDISTTELTIVNQLKCKINCITLPMFFNYWINQMESASLSLLRIATFIGLCSLFSDKISITDTKTVAVAVMIIALSTLDTNYKETILADVIKEMNFDKILECAKVILGLVEEVIKQKEAPLCQLFTDIEGDCIYTDLDYTIKSFD
ncbi:hypothetical protein GPJ56_001432 [Histomonas meleagridis]|uniref:uncharacterized protein n=1 Tax=Histomonas meleagridis TaxID=135588 RepID=UPI00355A4ED2|nr:hypothetical protein GPJ56_001432 [Histomonas meleagridis]KAH0798192.1 hypothetical protein GO595_009038 [Histomonas meleagridis]